ncbi:MAG: hypothetical protein ACLFV4_12265, partial [Candidatus Hydrogenedentota bacterium]
MRNRFERKVVGLAIIGMAVGLCLVVALPAGAQEIHEVSADFDALVDAIDAAGDGDEIRVQAGNIQWTQHVEITTDNLTLSGGWDSGFENREPATTIISGYDDDDNNMLVVSAGGDFTLDGFTFEGNDIFDADGIYFNPGLDSVSVLNNVFWENTFQRMLMTDGDTDGYDIVMDNNVFAGNETNWVLIVLNGENHTVTYNGNTSYDNPPGAVQIRTFHDGTFVTVTNSMFVSCQRNELDDNNPENWTVHNTLFFNNAWEDWSQEDYADTGDNNLIEEPLFADAGGGDFRLRGGSPAIGAADDDGNLGARDLPGTG